MLPDHAFPQAGGLPGQSGELVTALAGVTGRFYDRTQEARAAAQAYDPAARAELWRRSLELTGHPGRG
jgi:hypothetical protein